MNCTNNANRATHGFLFFWVITSLMLVSFFTFHVFGTILFVAVISAAVASVLARLLPGRRIFWMVIIWGVVAVLSSIALEGSEPGEFLNVNRTSCAVASLIFFLALALSKRPAFSLLVCAAIVAGLAGASIAKYQYTGVPLFWLDLHLAASTWQFLLGMQSTADIVAQIAGIAGIAVVGWQERPVRLSGHAKSWGVALCSAITLSTSALAVAPIAKNDDIVMTGQRAAHFDPWAIFLGSILTLSSLREPTSFDSSICCFAAQPEHLRASQVPAELPHVLVILEESTFPPGVLSTWAPKLKFFEQAYPMEAVVAGGATWLAEYALLHGVPHTVYGSSGGYINLLGPGKIEGRFPNFLKQLGYRTTTIYPVHHRFYGASTFHRSLGMDEFIDCNNVPGCAGLPWSEVHDARFFDTAEQKLRASRGPEFIFLPTIRQHSPHGVAARADSSCKEKSEVQCKILSDYAERLQDSVREFETLLANLQRLDREVVVLAFGDHIPADVSKHFAEHDFPAGKKRTFFTVWSSRRGYLTHPLMAALGNPPALNNAYLDLVLARASGMNNHYFSAKETALRTCLGAYCPDGKEKK